MLIESSNLYSTDALREIERAAIASGISGFDLMQRAAMAAFRLTRVRFPEATRLVVVCGNGNNGGDGYAFATLAQAAGLQVRLFALSLPREKSFALQARAQYEAAGGKVESVSHLHEACADSDLIVDALLGIGLRDAASADFAKIIETINSFDQPVLALDVPSGLDADRGSTFGVCVNASLTISFIAHKQGLFTGQGAHCANEKVLADLDLDAKVFALATTSAQVLQKIKLRSALPKRKMDSHKGRFGRVLVVGGNEGMSGAGVLSAMAALRSGAGLVSLATRSKHASNLNALHPEIMIHGVETLTLLIPLLQNASTIVVGPGLGRDDWSIRMLKACLEHAAKHNIPIVIDADGLNLIAIAQRDIPSQAVITPHPGEAATLLSIRSVEVQQDRFMAIQKLVERAQSTVVLKGNGSLIGAPNRHTQVCPFGNPGMSTAGMGDVLSGVIAAFLAQGMNQFDAACMGVLAHSLAADLVAQTGARGLLATDVIEQIRTVVNA